MTDHERTLREQGTVDIVDEHGVVIGEAVWRGELGKWDVKDKQFGIRSWAKSYARAESAVRRIVARKSSVVG